MKKRHLTCEVKNLYCSVEKEKRFHATVELIQYAGKHVMTQTCVHFLLAGDAVEWETKVDRTKKRVDPESLPEDTKETNVAVFLLHQVSVFSKWWARSEENFSIGLIGRFVFSFAAAGEPGPPNMASFESKVVVPILKDLFLSMLKTLGPHAPLPSDAPLLHWSTVKATQEDVHLYRVLCHELTRTIPMDETLANCLNKNGYWLSSVGFLNEVLVQMWPSVVDGTTKLQLHPSIGDETVKVAMEFFTARFLFGASVLCADMRKKTWDKSRKIRVLPADSRWNVPAALIIKLASCSMTITADMAARAAPMFRPLLTKGTPATEKAGALYVQALQYLMERGFGVSKHCNTSIWPMFVKRHYYNLPQSCKEQLAEISVHPLSFGLHIPWVPISKAWEPSMTHNTETKKDVRTNERPDGGENHKQENGAPDRHEPVMGRPEGEAEQDVVPAPDAEEEKEEEKEATSYNTIFCENLQDYISNFHALRERVCDALAKRRDPGVYTFYDKGCRGQTRKLMAECKQSACHNCTIRVWAFYSLAQDPPQLKVRMTGQHGRLEAPRGGRLWTVTEEHIIQNNVQEMTSAKVREALQKAGLRLRCTSGQLHNFISRDKMKQQGSGSRKQTGFTVAELKASMTAFQLDDMNKWPQLPVHQLIVLPGAVVEADRVCIIFTCPGMVSRGSGATNKAVKLAVDGKQKVLSNDYTIVTVSFLVPNETVAARRDAKKRAVRIKAHTCSQEPFVQALVSTEREENLTQIFETACVLAEKHCNVDLRRQVLQVHKDYAKGIEASRKKVFPHARRCDDYLHMRRAAYKTLEKLFGVGLKRSGPQSLCEVSVSKQQGPRIIRHVSGAGTANQK